MNDDVANASLSFFIVAIILTLCAAFSFFSPLALQTETPWEETAMRALAHFLPALIPLVIGAALRCLQAWAWYAGVFFMAAMFSLGLYLSIEHFVYILNGRFIPPVFLVLSVLSLPSLYLLFRGKMRLRRQIHGRDA